MPMLKDPSVKYKKFPRFELPNRQWPTRTIDKPPRWLATDLRDGNQSLPDPMTIDEKKDYFNKLVELGYKEIEVAFPSASQPDYDFTRFAVETAPDDVWIQALAPCRENLIRRTVESLKGAKKAIVHIYLAVSKLFRDTVLDLSEQQCIELAVKCTKLVRELTKDDPTAAETEWTLEFSPEFFSGSDTEFCVRICEEVKKAWEPSEENQMIFNLPATVEMTTPNVYADQIEYFCTNITEREKVCVSLHPHNDRGCAVAAAELGQMAGANRVEGCLFGNGERTGNVDLVTLALNLYTQGIQPHIDFSDMNSVVDIVERCNKIPVHPRAPYGGSLVVCAFSGSHQDAIKKGFKNYHATKEAQNTQHSCWEIPYLPLDPEDVGRTYEAVIRVNSQSGKGGAAWIVLQKLELDMPRDMQVVFGVIVQREAEFKGRELKSNELVELFQREYYLNHTGLYKLEDYHMTASSKSERSVEAKVSDTKSGQDHKLHGAGNGPISAFLDAIKNAFGLQLDVKTYHEHSIGGGSKTRAASYVQLANTDGAVEWGVGIHEDVSQASILAILSCANRFANRK